MWKKGRDRARKEGEKWVGERQRASESNQIGRYRRGGKKKHKSLR